MEMEPYELEAGVWSFPIRVRLGLRLLIPRATGGG